MRNLIITSVVFLLLAGLCHEAFGKEMASPSFKIETGDSTTMSSENYQNEGTLNITVPKSAAQTVYPIVGAIAAADKYLGGNCPWRADNACQVNFLESYREIIKNGDIAMLGKDIESFAGKPKEINNLLSKRGYSIQLDPKLDFGAVGILNLQFAWENPGCPTEIESDKMKYPAVHVEDIPFFETANGQTMVQLATKSKYHVWIMIADQLYTANEDLSIAAETMIRGAKRKNTGTIVFPMIDFHQSTQLDWLIGLSEQHGNEFPTTIQEAKQEIVFQMDENGARMKSAAAAGMSRGICKYLQIDKPFIVAITADGLKKPVFSGYFAQDSWKDPKSLRKLTREEIDNTIGSRINDPSPNENILQKAAEIIRQ